MSIQYKETKMSMKKDLTGKSIQLKRAEVVETEYSIQRKLILKYSNQAKYMVHNMCYQLGEMDMFMLRRSGYAEEFEIKCSTSDLRADKNKVRKFRCLMNTYKGKPEYRYVMPNKFSYVVGPLVKYQGIEIPEFAGLYVVDQFGLTCIKNPKFIYRTKYIWDEKVAASCAHRLMNRHFNLRK